jgi:Domain of unknown function (DUF4402)
MTKDQRHIRFQKAPSTTGGLRRFFKDKTICRRLEMKKLFLVSAIVLGFAGMSFAQLSGSQGINVDVSILKALKITSYGDASFGTTYAGVDSVILNPGSPASGQTAGTFVVNGEPNHAINVSFTSTSPAVTGAAVTFAPSLVGFTSNSQTSATSVGTSVPLDASTGDYYFWVGGTLRGITASAVSGSYSGTFTLTISY